MPPPSSRAPQRAPPAPSDDNLSTGGAGAGTSGTSSLWSRLPQPTGQAAPPPSAGGLLGLPPPKGGAAAAAGGPAKKKVVTLPFRKELLEAVLDSDDDEAPAAKRVKTGGGKSRLMDFLPPPKYETRAAVPALGAGPAKPAAKPASAAAAAEPAAAGAGALPADFFAGGNEVYRVREEGGDDGTGAVAGPSAAYPAGPSGAHAAAAYDYGGGYEGYDYSAYDYASYAAARQGYAAGPGPAPGPAPGPCRPPAGPGPGPASGRDAAAAAAAAEASAEDLLAEALRAEQERASKRGGGGGAGAGLKLVEISAKDLTQMDPAAREAANSARDALGPEYALSLRRSAAPFEGSKMARRKHQIGTLLFNARMQELEHMEKRTQGQKSKAETAAKYGW